MGKIAIRIYELALYDIPIHSAFVFEHYLDFLVTSQSKEESNSETYIAKNVSIAPGFTYSPPSLEMIRRSMNDEQEIKFGVGFTDGRIVDEI